MMLNNPPTESGWYWWTPPTEAGREVVYVSTLRSTNTLTATRLTTRAHWVPVEELGGTWLRPCTPAEIDRETASLQTATVEQTDEDFPLFI